MSDIPAVIIDLPQVDTNITRFHDRVLATGRQVRAHLKAHRTIELAQRQVAAGAVGVAVHTAGAAVQLARAGIGDVVLAWPWPEAWRFPVFADAAAEVPRFAIHVDRPESITGMAAAALARGVEVGVRIDLRHAPADSVAALARLAVQTPGVWFDGLSSYCPTATAEQIRDRHQVGLAHAKEVVDLAEALRQEGIECPAVGIGGTPTASGACEVAGVTEICAGVYATYDGGMAQAGVCSPGEVALTVAADAAELLTGCAQPWEPEVLWLPASGSRVTPAHVCPLAVNLLKVEGEYTVMAAGEQVASWRPFAAPDKT